jgi:hypothetical protein
LKAKDGDPEVLFITRSRAVRYHVVWVVAVSVCLALVATAQGGVFTTTVYSSDSDSGITTQYTYTHAVDLGGSGETINGVPFVADSSANRVTYQYDVSPALVGTAATDNLPAGSGVRNLTTQYIYDDSSSPGDLTLTLKGLTVGYTYTTTFYDIGSGSAGSQYTRVRDGDAIQYVYDENYNGNGNGTLLSNTFTATTTTYTYTFITDTVDSNPGDPNVTPLTSTFFLYGFSNQVVTPEPSTLTIFTFGLPILLGYRRLRRKTATSRSG